VCGQKKGEKGRGRKKGGKRARCPAREGSSGPHDSRMRTREEKKGNEEQRAGQ